MMGILCVQVFVRSRPIDKEKLGKWNKGVLSIAIIGISFFVVGFLPTVFVASPHLRLLVPNSQYLYPALILLITPPFWLKYNI